MTKYYLLLGAVLLFCSACEREESDDRTISINQRGLLENERIPDPRPEFRAAWVATINNIDWPSRPGLSAADQQKEARAIMDRLVQVNMNAVIFQARPQADALYQSETEPWSNVLTGKQGGFPVYDPMKFWIHEAHKRGLLFHAWMNPFRANHKSHNGELSDRSVIKVKSEWAVELGNEGYIWLKPTLKEVRGYAQQVILEVVQNYDIDGLHIDDYFYPYPAYNAGKDFPDLDDYHRYRKKGGKLSQGDWRRDAVNTFVRELNSRIKEAKPHVEFGISPFGIWRPDHPKGTVGFDQYAELYADPKLWLNKGWCDYMAPQLYWPISQSGQNFSSLLDWWRSENKQKRHVWPGITLVNTTTKTGVTEVSSQILFTRRSLGSRSGMCLFSSNWLTRPRHQIAQELVSGPWETPTIAPQTPWVKNKGEVPKKPHLQVLHKRDGELLVQFKREKTDSVFQYVINEKLDGEWQKPIVIAGNYGSYPIKKNVSAIAVRIADRSRQMSAYSIANIESFQAIE